MPDTTPSPTAPLAPTGPFNLMERPAFGAMLAFACGAMNAWTLINAGTFATVQSGNVASSGIYLAMGEWGKVAFALFSVLAFGLGSLAVGIYMSVRARTGARYSANVTGALAALLVVLTLLVVTSAVETKHYHYIAYAVSFTAGALGNSFHKAHGMLFGAVAVTFVVQMAFNFLVQSRFSRNGINGYPNLKWSGIFFLVLLGFASGGAIGALLVTLGGTKPSIGADPADIVANGGFALLLPALVLAIMSALAVRESRAGRNPDPTPGGLIA